MFALAFYNKTTKELILRDTNGKNRYTMVT